MLGVLKVRQTLWARVAILIQRACRCTQELGGCGITSYSGKQIAHIKALCDECVWGQGIEGPPAPNESSFNALPCRDQYQQHSWSQTYASTVAWILSIPQMFIC